MLAAAILGFFAFAPIYIGVGSVAVIVAEPEKFDWFFVTVVAVCASLAYFLLLLAYRALTGRGRKSDDALLPPAVIGGFLIAFGICGLAIMVYGIAQGNFAAIAGGVVYLIVALQSWRSRRDSKARQINDE